MSKPMKSLLLLAPLCVLALGSMQPAAALAQAQAPAQAPAQEKTFNLSHVRQDTTRRAAEQAAPRFEPRLRGGDLEIGLSLGFLDLNTTLLEHEQMIYKITDELIYWGDVKLVGESAFNPVLRLSYSLSPWLALEGRFNFSVSQYQAQISNMFSKENSTDAGAAVPVEALGEFDAEHRSVLTYGGGLAALFYPFDLSGDRVSRWHPYVIGVYDRLWYDLNSNYVSGASAEWVRGLGGGIRFIADDLVSIRIEAAYMKTDLELTPSTNFEVLNEGTLPIPLWYFVQGNPRTIESFQKESLGSLAWSVGFIANF